MLAVSPAAREYDSFGNLIPNSETGTWVTRFSFQGQSWWAIRSADGLKTIFKSLKRDYDPVTGRFLQNEPLLGRRSFAQYLFAAQNPTSMVDPLGLQGCDASLSKKIETFQCVQAPARTYKRAPNDAVEGLLYWDRKANDSLASGPEIKAWEPGTLESLEIAIRRAWEKYVEGYWLQRWNSPNAEAGARTREEHKQYLIDRTPQGIQIIQGSVEIAAGVSTANPFLVVHGIDTAGTGVVGWAEGRYRDTLTGQLVDRGMSLLDASEQNRVIAKWLVEGALPAAAPSIGRSIAGQYNWLAELYRGPQIPIHPRNLANQIGKIRAGVGATGGPPCGVRSGTKKEMPPGWVQTWGNRPLEADIFPGSGWIRRLPYQADPLYYFETDIWALQSPSASRGAERLIFGKGGEVWYTPDHYLSLFRLN